MLMCRALVVFKLLLANGISHFQHISRVPNFLVDVPVRLTKRVSVDVEKGDGPGGIGHADMLPLVRRWRSP